MINLFQMSDEIGINLYQVTWWTNRFHNVLHKRPHHKTCKMTSLHGYITFYKLLTEDFHIYKLINVLIYVLIYILYVNMLS